MNLGIYIKSLDDDEEMQWATKIIDHGIENNKLSDASIFYDNIGFNPYQSTCGLFNSTDLWNFSGSLIVLNKDSLRTASKIVNNIKLYYYYGWGEKPTVFDLLDSYSKKIEIICKNDKDQKTIYRLTGQKAEIIKEDDELLNLIGK